MSSAEDRRVRLNSYEIELIHEALKVSGVSRRMENRFFELLHGSPTRAWGRVRRPRR
jgi:hypothetical protein